MYGGMLLLDHPLFLLLIAFFQVDVCKQAYNQEDLEDENECEVSCRDVGHNIFILAHQVLPVFHIHSKQKLKRKTFAISRIMLTSFFNVKILYSRTLPFHTNPNPT